MEKIYEKLKQIVESQAQVGLINIGSNFFENFNERGDRTLANISSLDKDRHDT